MRAIILAATALVLTAPAFAETAGAPSTATLGTMLRDSNNMRLGRIEQVRPDGSVGLIVGSKFVIVPASKLSVADGKVSTSLSKREVTALN